MEHIWVEAFVDTYPSRGAENKIPEGWVPMDAAFKQYAYTQGMNIQQGVPFDAQTFSQDIQNSTTINQSEGWIQNVDQSYIQNRFAAYRQNVSDFINSQKANATVGDILGRKTILKFDVAGLATGLPYHLVVIGNRYSALPATLRYQFTYGLNDGSGSELFAYTASTPSLAGKKIALSFRPATQTDVDTLASYMPKPHQDGSPIQPSELPQSLPGYLVSLIPELTLDGNVVASGAAVVMGTDLNTEKGYSSPKDGWQTGNKALVAGEYHAIGLDLQGISPSLASALQSSLSNAKTQLGANSLGGLTKHDLTGAILQAGVISYFAANDAQDQMSQLAAKVVDVRLPSYGTFQTDMSTTYSYGAPRKVSFIGTLMDIDLIHNAVTSKDNGTAFPINYLRINGTRESAFEHLISEQIFNDPNQTDPNANVVGVSAVRALAIAAGQGQRIYTITQNNVDAILPNLSLGANVQNEIRDAAYAGNEITTHQSLVNYKGFNGAGYIIIDPKTGSGAYKISSGADGAASNLAQIGTGILQGLAIGISIIALVLQIFFIATAFPLYAAIASAVGIAATLVGTKEFGVDPVFISALRAVVAVVLTAELVPIVGIPLAFYFLIAIAGLSLEYAIYQATALRREERKLVFA